MLIPYDKSQNFFANGNFAINNRLFTTASLVNTPIWTVDRWMVFNGGTPGVGSATLSSSSIPENGWSKNSIILTYATGAGNIYIGQRIKSSTARLLNNKVICISFMVKTSHASSIAPLLSIQTPTVSDDFTTLNTALTTIPFTSCPGSATTTFTRISAKIHLNNVTDIDKGIQICLNLQSGMLLNGETFTISQGMLNEGSFPVDLSLCGKTDSLEGFVTGTPDDTATGLGYVASTYGGAGGGAAKTPADGFNALISDSFDVSPSSSTTKISSTNTTASYSVSKAMYSMACDKSQSITISGTTVTMSGTPSFTVTAGCIIWVDSLAKWARISTVNSQTSYVIDYAIGNVTTAAGMVAQAVSTKDLVNYGDATQKTRLRDFFPTTANLTCHVEYSDSLAVGDNVADQVDTACVVVSCSNEGLQSDTSTYPTSDKYSVIFTRPTMVNAPNILDLILATNTNQQRFFATFFPNPNNTSVTANANVINYDISLYAQSILTNGGFLNSAFTYSDGSGSQYQCSAPSLVSGNTQITLAWDFIPQVNSGSPDGDIEVLVDGKLIPRFITGLTGLYWKEVTGSTRTIEINSNLTVLSPAISISVRRRQGTTDVSAQNSVKLAVFYDAIVGSAADVSAGRAQYSSIQSAINAIAAGSTSARILILTGTYTETVTLNRAGITIEGVGIYAYLNGTLTVSSNYDSISNIKVDNLTISGGRNFAKVWMNTGGTLSDTGTDNAVSVIVI